MLWVHYEYFIILFSFVFVELKDTFQWKTILSDLDKKKEKCMILAQEICYNNKFLFAKKNTPSENNIMMVIMGFSRRGNIAWNKRVSKRNLQKLLAKSIRRIITVSFTYYFGLIEREFYTVC